MAISKSITLESGIELPNAYIRIDSFNYVNRVNEAPRVELLICIYKDEEARQRNKPEVVCLTALCSGDDFYTYFDLTVLEQLNISMISQAYLWLKTKDFYKDAVDILGMKE